MSFLIRHQHDLMIALQAICLLTAFLTLRTNNLSRRRKAAIIFLELSATGILSSQLAFTAYSFMMNGTALFITRLSKFGDYFFPAFLILNLNFYLKDLFQKEGELKKMPWEFYVAGIVLLIEIALVIISQFTGLYYTIDARNNYIRGPARPLAYIFPCAALLLQFICILRNFKRIPHETAFPLLLFIAIPIAASAIQFKMKGFYITGISSAGMAILLFIFDLKEMNKKVERAHRLEIEMLARYQKELEQTVDERTKELRIANQKVERLLLNILPADVARELTERPGQTISRNYPNATVLFTDIVGFTKMSSDMTADQTVRMLNKLTSLFDERTEREGVEKIKTIGDSYMAAAGLDENAQNGGVEKMVRFAQGLLRDVEEFNKTAEKPLQIRVGINSGELVAGVIGKTKFIYDIWGDTVNVASRMESSGQPMKIHVSEAAQKQADDKFSWQGPVQVEVKGKGLMNGYFVDE